MSKWTSNGKPKVTKVIKSSKFPKSKKQQYGFTEQEATKLKELLSNSAWSTKGFPDGSFAEDTETPAMIFFQINADKLRKVNELKSLQCDLELALRQKAIKEILNDENGALLRQMNDVKNELLGLENERNKMVEEHTAIKKEIEALSQEQIDLEKKKQRLIKKITKIKKEVFKIKEDISNSAGNGTIKDLEV